MTRDKLEARFIDLLDGVLGDAEAQALWAEIQANPEIARAFADYESIVATERLLAAESHVPHPSLEVKVMEEVRRASESAGFFSRLWRSCMNIGHVSRGVGASLALVTCGVVALIIAGGNYERVSELRAKEAQMPASQSVKRQQEAAPVAQIESDAKRLLSAVTTTAPQAEPHQITPPPAKTMERARGGAPADRLQEFRRDGGEKKIIIGNSGVVHPEDERLQAMPSEQSQALEDVAVYQRHHSEIGSAQFAVKQPALARSDDISDAPCCAVRRDSYFAQPPSTLGGEAYFSYTENPRIRTASEALSTFSIDVDTASYANARRYISRGALPPKDSVRIEEFINYFDYAYPAQESKPFGVDYEIAPSPLDNGRFLLKLGIKAREVRNQESGWNLVFLVDVSGSMDESNKLPLIKKALPLLVEKMRSFDRVAIVTYAGDAGVALDSTPGSEKAKILSAIDNLRAGGSTHGSAGIIQAYEIAQRNFRSGAVNRVILATDGDFNVGVTSQADLVRLIEEKRRSGITLTTLGLGTGNLNDSMMEQLADKGNGNYFYLDSIREARKVLETDLTANMEVVAKDVKLQIEFNPSQVLEYRLIGYDNRRLNKEDFANDQVDAGEIGAGHTVTALYELVLADSDLARRLVTEYRYAPRAEAATSAEKQRDEHPAELAFLKLRYKEPQGATSELVQFPIEAARLKRNVSESSADFKFAAAVSYFAAILRGSQFTGNYGFKEIAELAQQGRGEDHFGYRQEFIELVKDAAALRG